MQQAYVVKANEGQVVEHHILLQGAGSSDPSVEAGGAGITATRTGEGAYKLAFSENQGVFLGWHCDLAAATPGDLAGHTVIRDTYDGDAQELEFTLYNDTPAAHDLAADEYFDIVVKFKRTSA